MAENQSAILGQRTPGSGPRKPLGEGIKSGQITSTDFGSPGAVGTVTATAPLPGALVGNTITVNPTAALPAGIAIAAVRVSAADVVSITLVNITAAPVAVGVRTFDYNLTA